jgi:hypothetical protein
MRSKVRTSHFSSAGVTPYNDHTEVSLMRFVSKKLKRRTLMAFQPGQGNNVKFVKRISDARGIKSW